MLSGVKETLQAHHWIVSSSRSLKYRYDIRNGVCLSFAEHKYGVHTQASYAYTRRIADAMVAAGNVTWAEIEEIMDDPTKTTDYNREELNAILVRLQGQLEKIKMQKLGQIWPQLAAAHIPVEMYTGELVAKPGPLLTESKIFDLTRPDLMDGVTMFVAESQLWAEQNGYTVNALNLSMGLVQALAKSHKDPLFTMGNEFGLSCFGDFTLSEGEATTSLSKAEPGPATEYTIPEVTTAEILRTLADVVVEHNMPAREALAHATELLRLKANAEAEPTHEDVVGALNTLVYHGEITQKTATELQDKLEATPGPTAYVYWSPGDLKPALLPPGCEMEGPRAKNWVPTDMQPEDWFRCRRRWPKVEAGEAEAKPGPVLIADAKDWPKPSEIKPKEIELT